MSGPIGNELIAATGVSSTGIPCSVQEYFTISQISGTAFNSGSGVMPTINGGTGLQSSKLYKIQRAITKAQANNPYNTNVTVQPTITTAYDGSVSNFFTANSVVAGTPYFNLLGGSPYIAAANVSGSLNGYIATATSYSGTQYAGQTVFEFYSDGPRVQIRMAQSTSTSTVRVEVNGSFLSLTGNLTASGGGEQQLVLDWNGQSQVRLYRVHIGGGGWLSRIGVGTLYNVWAPSTQDYVNVVWSGDSYVQGVGSYIADNSFADVASALLGFLNPIHSAFQGTGYVNPGSYTNFIGHVSDVINQNPDLVIVAGGTNDTGYTSAQVQAAVYAYITAIRNGLPTVPIIVLGVWPKATGPSAAILSTETAVQAGVTQFIAATSDKITAFVPIANATTGSWITGTGYQGATNGSGNSDYYIWTDGTHPNDVGHAYLGYRTASGIRNAIMSITP